MADIQVFSSCIALLADIVDSRGGDRPATHEAVLAAVEKTNANVSQLDPLRVTIGDELQGVYATPGDAFAAAFALREALAGDVELRFGLGGGEVRIIDADRGIQDGSAWIAARAAIEAAEERSRQPGLAGARTGLVGIEDGDTGPIAALSTLVDAHLARLGDGPRATLRHLRAGDSNAAAAKALGISASANSQRVANNDLRPLAQAIEALVRLPAPR